MANIQELQKTLWTAADKLPGKMCATEKLNLVVALRMDTLSIDGEGNPCIVEYKKDQNESVINQSLSYLRWLLDHKDSFEKLYQEANISM